MRKICFIGLIIFLLCLTAYAEKGDKYYTGAFLNGYGWTDLEIEVKIAVTELRLVSAEPELLTLVEELLGLAKVQFLRGLEEGGILASLEVTTGIAKKPRCWC